MKLSNVGAIGRRFDEKDSVAGLKAMESIQSSGKSVISARTAVTAIQMQRTSVTCVREK
jgi:hypothetical protein